MNKFSCFMEYLKEADCYLAMCQNTRHIKKASCKTENLLCRIENLLKCFK